MFMQSRLESLLTIFTLEREGLQTSNLVCGWSTMTRITDMHGDVQAESCG